MYSELQFVNDFVRAYPAYNRSDRSARAIDLCYRAYLNSSRAHLGCLVVGRIVKGAASAGVPLMVGLGDIERVNFGITGDRDPGSVLWSSYWSIPLNDAWLMGGIHAWLPFYLASPRTKENIVDPTFGFTVTGRELIGLMTFGYSRNPNTRLGEVFECSNPAKARSATFTQYEAAFRAAKSKGDWKELAS
jgi:hypothetical protein